MSQPHPGSSTSGNARATASNRRRVLIVGRHFWPDTWTDAGLGTMQLALGLHRGGLHVEVLTPRHAGDWPGMMRFRDVLVHRPMAAPRGDWSMARYGRAIAHWLRQFGLGFDVWMVESARDEAAVVIETARASKRPVVIRQVGWGTQSDPLWWPKSRSARRCGVAGRLADLTLTPNADAERATLAAGYAADRVGRFHLGFASGPHRDPTRRQRARRSLANANADLICGPHTRVAISFAPLRNRGGVETLINALPRLSRRDPDLRVWIIGDGPDRERIHQRLRGEGMRGCVAMPGGFAELDDLLAAADAWIQTDDDGLAHLLPEAVAAGLPVVACDRPAIRDRLRCPAGADDPGDVHWFTARANSLADAMLTALNTGGPEGIGPSKGGVDPPGPANLRRRLLLAAPRDSAIGELINAIERLASKHSSVRDSRRTVQGEGAGS